MSLNECTTFKSRSFFPFDWELKRGETTDSLSRFAPVSRKPLRMSTDACHCLQRLSPERPNTVGTLLAAVCMLLPSVVEIVVASSRRGKFRWLSGRLIGVCSLAKQPDTPLQWLEGQGFYLVLSNDVDDAEGRDREKVGDEAKRGKRTEGTFNKDMTDENVFENCSTLIPFTLNQCQCPQVKKVQCCVRTRKKSVCARTWCLHIPVALTAVATGWVRNSDSATSDCSQTYRLMVTTLSLQSTHAVSSCY